MLGLTCGGVKNPQRHRTTILGYFWKKLVIKKSCNIGQTHGLAKPWSQPTCSPWCSIPALIPTSCASWRSCRSSLRSTYTIGYDTQRVSGCQRGNGVNQSSPNISKHRLEAKLWANECVWCWDRQPSLHWHVIHALLNRDDHASDDRS